jgi:choice-of-anchor B domain-containing protein
MTQTVKHFFLFQFICLACFNGAHAQTYKSSNVNLSSNWFDPALISLTQPNDQRYSSVWGYYDGVKNREYGIIGGINGTYFIDVTNPSAPVLADYVKGRRNNCIWREYKNFGKYLYMVSDDGAPNSFQIVDMSYLPDSVSLVYDSDQLFARAHTVYVDGNNLYCGSVKTSDNKRHSMAIYDLTNPIAPQLISKLQDYYPNIDHVHDMYVRNDTIYASCGYDGLYVFKLKQDKSIEMLGSLTVYPFQGYNHSSSLTDDGKILIMTDEVPNALKVKVLDVSDLSDIKVLSTFESNAGATPHNPHVIGNKVVISYYEDGAWIFDITSPEFTSSVGYFDTYPQNGNSFTSSYQGCWGVYPYLPSGNLLASDMQNGLFILNPSVAYSGVKNIENEKQLKVFPMPFKDEFWVELPSNVSSDLEFTLTDLGGKALYKEKVTVGQNFSFKFQIKDNFAPGIYLIHLKGADFNLVGKIIRN